VGEKVPAVEPDFLLSEDMRAGKELFRPVRSDNEAAQGLWPISFLLPLVFLMIGAEYPDN
jgi:hypothetical protein